MIGTDLKEVILDAIFSVTTPTSVVLFGSYAKGCPGQDSDIDICITTDDEKNFFDLMTEIRLALFKRIKQAFDIVIFSSSDFNQNKDNPVTFEYEIQHTGVSIYG